MLSTATEDEWTTEEEIQLFLALHGLRPVGINKHFFMVCILDRLQKTLNRKISSEQIWKHLKTMYNLKALDDLEPLPFPNNEENFVLPLDLIKLKDVDEETSIKDVEKKAVQTSTNNSLSVQKSNNVNKNTSSSERVDKKPSTKSSESERIQPKRTRGSNHHELNNFAEGETQTKRRRI